MPLGEIAAVELSVFNFVRDISYLVESPAFVNTYSTDICGNFGNWNLKGVLPHVFTLT